MTFNKRNSLQGIKGEQGLKGQKGDGMAGVSENNKTLNVQE